MGEVVEILRRLHRILRQIADIRGQLERGPKTIKSSKNVWDLATKALGDHREEIKKKRMDADRMQLQLRTREAKIFDFEGKMNMAKGDREYQTLKEQIAADRQANLVLSDELLELLEAIDEMVRSTPQYEERVQQTEADFKKSKRPTNERKAVLEVELARVTEELNATESRLNGELLTRYRRLVETRGDDALAPLDRNACGSCNTSLSPRIIDRLKMNEPMFCTSCGCLIYPSE